MKFFVEILRERDSIKKSLYGFIPDLNVDLEQSYGVTFTVMGDTDIKIPLQEVKLYIDDNSKYDNYCYFRIGNIRNFLEQYNILDKEFFVEINIGNQLFKSCETIRYV